MSEAHSGYVTFVNTKDWNGRNGPVTLYSFRIEGDDTYWRTGRDDPQLQKGQFAKFTAEGQNVDVTSIERGDIKVETAAPKKSGGGSASSRNEYWENKDKHDKEVVQPRIMYCAARRDAITIATAALNADALKLGSKAATKVDNFVGAVVKLTAELLDAQTDYLEGEDVTRVTSASADEVPEDAWGDD